MDLADNFKKSNLFYHIFLLVISLNTKYTYFQLKCHVVIVLVPASHVSHVSPFSSYRLAPLKMYLLTASLLSSHISILLCRWVLLWVSANCSVLSIPGIPDHCGQCMLYSAVCWLHTWTPATGHTIRSASGTQNASEFLFLGRVFLVLQVLMIQNLS